jgi:peptide/nickel transport system substrate-binding protein
MSSRIQLSGRSLPIAVLALAALLPACSGSSSAHGNGLVPRSFTFALPAAPTSLDSTKDSSSPAAQVDSIINDPLEWLGAGDSLTPALASSVTTPNDTTIVYHLRGNVRFSNGDPLTAQDVAWSINHTFNAGAGSQLAPNLTTIKNVIVNGPNEVTVHLTRPTAAARANIAIWSLIQDAKYAQAHSKDFGTPAAVPIGTGPYKVASDTANGITLERNSHYWGPRPFAQTINFVFIAQDSTAQLAMRSGSIQGYSVGNPRTIPQWQAIAGARLYSLPTVSSEFLSLDVTSAPYDDIHVRRAIAYAIDREGLNQAIYSGHASLLRGLVPASAIATVAPSADAAQSFLNSLPQYGFDLPDARAELAKSAYPHGFTMTLPYWSDYAPESLTALNLQQNLRSIGITVKLKPLSETEWLTQLYAHRHLGAQISVVFEVPSDPNGGLALLVGNANAVANGLNVANFYPPGVERAWAQVTESSVNASRWQGVKTILQAIATGVPYIPLFDAPTFVVLGGGYTFAGSTDELDLINGRWVFMIA